jgi:hypothetical protein
MASSFTDTLPQEEQWEWLPEELTLKVLGQDGVDVTQLLTDAAPRLSPWSAR